MALSLLQLARGLVNFIGHMIQDTIRQYQRYLSRFRVFQRTCPDLPLGSQARHFLATLTPSSARIAKYALESSMSEKISPRRLPHPYWRNEPKLAATVFRLAEWDSLKQAPLTPRQRALVGVLFSLRRAEASRLVWGDLNLADGLVAVPNGKGGKPDWTILTQFARGALAHWQAVSGHTEPGDAVFLGVTGQTLGRQIRGLLTALGLYRPYRGAHAFRRTFATVFLRAHPGELRALQKLLRHENIATTCQYDYPRPEDLVGKVAQLGL